MKYTFTTDDQSTAFFDEISGEMIALFNISQDDAVGRINRQWKGQSFVGPDDLIYHETAVFWAKTLYYGVRVKWWLNPPGLAPRPYP
ncbi:hypothetical protein OKA05_24115 [Luteolibacter arcticus]|uniref:Uncharacterized protein n=1 Tax=Luteolibacter arcticus TaxID=1581411 RepID=A0ABT3GQ56_9BACT|nr:hypothetical protein [Luteolibacter arcticus]MCW1925666.1 hypothetical protein [Luteolibacter arcticus]